MQVHSISNQYRRSVYLFGLLTIATGQVMAEVPQNEIEKALVKDYPRAVIQEIERLSDGSWDVDFIEDGESYEAVYGANGQLISVQNEDFSSADLYLGLYASNESAIYKGADRETDVYPLIWYDTGDFYIRGRSLGYRLLKGEFTLAAEIDIEIGEGYDPEDSDYLSDMDELDLPVSVGIVLEKEFPVAELEFGLFADVAGAHKGMTANFGISREFEFGNDWILEIGVETSWHDSKYNDYYYGVAEKFARADRPAYEADSGFDISFETAVRGRLWGNWYMLSELEYVTYSSAMKDSPLTDKDNQTSISIGVAYAF